MTINIFVLKGDLNGKIVVVRFFFCPVYTVSGQCCQIITSNLALFGVCVETITVKFIK